MVVNGYFGNAVMICVAPGSLDVNNGIHGCEGNIFLPLLSQKSFYK
jgi:hypothetical protein